jgi:hypothetical protein
VANSFQQNAFFNSFTQGYSFIDNIKRAERQEARLEQRLAEEREDRAFQRSRQVRSDQVFEQDRKFQLEERARVASAREKAKAGISAAVDPDATIEELMELAPFSPEAFAAARKKANSAELTRALDVIEQQQAERAAAEQQGLTAQLQAEQAAQGGANAGQLNAAAAEGATPAEGESLFAAPRGQTSQRRVTEEDIEFFDPEFREKGLAGKVGEFFTGNIQQATRAAGNVLEGTVGRGSIAGTERGPRAAGAAFLGEAFISEEFVTVEEFNQITDPEERERVRRNNNRLITDQKRVARNPNRNKLARPITRQGAVQEGGEIERDHLQRIENQLDRRYSAFLEGTGESGLEQKALEAPEAAAMDYFNDRATLQTMWSDERVAEVDRRMVPVMDTYEQNVSQELSAMSPGTPAYGRTSAQLSSIQTSRDIIARGQPSPNKRAGINSDGVKIGDKQRAEDVVAAIIDPDNPTVTTHTQAEIDAALTITDRVTPGSKRLNDVQTRAAQVLVEQSYMSADAALQFIMTGKYPSAALGKPTLTELSDGTVYASYDGGGLAIVHDTKKLGDRKPSQEMDAEKLGWAQAGMKTIFPNADDRQIGQLNGLMIDHASWIRGQFNVTSQEQMYKLGRLWAESIMLSSADRKDRASGLDAMFKINANYARPADIFFNPELREKIALDNEIDLISMPDYRDIAGQPDVEAIRQAARNGDYGIFMAENADKVEDDFIIQVAARSEYIRWQQESQTGEFAPALGQ